MLGQITLHRMKAFLETALDEKNQKVNAVYQVSEDVYGKHFHFEKMVYQKEGVEVSRTLQQKWQVIQHSILPHISINLHFYTVHLSVPHFDIRDTL